MAKGKHTQMLFASHDAMATMPPESVTKFAAQLEAYGIGTVVVDANVDCGEQVEDALRAQNRIVGFIGRSEKDIPGLIAATRNGGLAICLGGPASQWCAREEGRSLPLGRCLEVRQPSDAIRAIQSAIGGF